MADVLSQSLKIVRGEDVNIVLSGAAADFSEAPTSWALQFSISKNRGQTPVLTVTSITIAGSGPYTATIPLTRAQTSSLELEQYDWDVWRTNSGSVSIKAGGQLMVETPVYPPVTV